MLATQPIDPILLAPDLKESRDFYVEKLGLEILSEDDSAVNGIVDTGDALHAWIVDPGKNTLGIDQHK